MTTEEQIQTMRNEINAMRRRMQIFALAGGVVLLLAVIGYGVGAAKVQDKVKASSFVVVDENGTERAVLEVSAKGHTRLRMFDAKGNPRAALAVFDNGPSLSMADTQVKVRTVLSVHETEGPGLKMFDAKGNARAIMDVHEDVGALLGMYDAKGKSIWHAPIQSYVR